jgi:deoxyribonuclease-1-like protein
MKYKLIALLIILLILDMALLVYADLNKNYKASNETKHPASIEDFSIACWNLQTFGDTKASNDTLLNFYANKFDDYDIFIVQEIRDSDDSSIQKLSEKLSEYDYIISSRAGKNTSKEQYAVFYNDRVKLIDDYDYIGEYQNSFERPPFKVTFMVVNWTFTIFTIYVKPDDVNNELTNLENLIGNVVGDTIIIGDLNADGSYYDEDHIIHFTGWNWIIGNNVDTTVAESNNTYDRIIINNGCLNNYISSGVMDDVKTTQSDHYLVYARFNPNEP